MDHILKGSHSQDYEGNRKERGYLAGGLDLRKPMRLVISWRVYEMWVKTKSLCWISKNKNKTNKEQAGPYHKENMSVRWVEVKKQLSKITIPKAKNLKVLREEQSIFKSHICPGNPVGIWMVWKICFSLTIKRRSGEQGKIKPKVKILIQSEEKKDSLEEWLQCWQLATQMKWKTECIRKESETGKI